MTDSFAEKPSLPGRRTVLAMLASLPVSAKAAEEPELPPAPPTRLPCGHKPRNAREWQQMFLAETARRKRYPAALLRRAKESGEPPVTGSATVSFSVDRAGTIRSAELARTSGVPELDEAALAMLKPGFKLPALPPDMTGETHRFTVPVQFRN